MSQSKKGTRLRITSRKVHYTVDEIVAILLKEKLPYKLSRKYLNIIVCVRKYSRIVIYTYLGPDRLKLIIFDIINNYSQKIDNVSQLQIIGQSET